MAERINKRSCSPESLKTLARIRELIKTISSKAQIARIVGKSRPYVSQVLAGTRPRVAKLTFTMAHLQLRYSTKLCRTCGQVAGIITKSRRCIKCELRELAKVGVIKIVSEDEVEEEEFAEQLVG